MPKSMLKTSLCLNFELFESYQAKFILIYNISNCTQITGFQKNNLSYKLLNLEFWEKEHKSYEMLIKLKTT